MQSSRIEVVVAIVFHSGNGHTARQAEAVRRGAERVSGTSVLYLTSVEAQAHWDDLAKVDVIIFDASTYMGSVSGPFKPFTDSTSKVLRPALGATKSPRGLPTRLRGLGTNS
jgi:multimeric flavodoxin WrbA